MTPRQLSAHQRGILAHARHLIEQGVPFDDHRVGQLLDAAFLLKRQRVANWEELYNEILRLYGQLPAPA